MVLRSRRRFLATVGAAAAGSAVVGGVGVARREDVQAALPELEQPALDRSGWPTALGGPGHAGTAAWTSGPREQPSPAWSFDFDVLCPTADVIPRVTGMAVHGDGAFVGLDYGRDAENAGSIAAFDVEDGSRRWTDTYQEVLPLPPAVADGRVFVVDPDGTIRALDADSGDELWARDVGVDGAPNAGDRSVSDVTVAAEAVYVTGDETYALEASTGSVRWRSDECFWPSTDGKRVYGYDLRGREKYLVAADPATGTVQWTFRMETDMGLPDESPAVEDGLAIGISGFALFAVDTATGEEVWSSFEDGLHRHALGPERSYGTTTDGPFLHAHDASNGDSIWHDVSAEPRAFVADDETVFADLRSNREYEHGALTAFDGADGTARWRIDEIEGDPGSVRPHAVADGTLYAEANETLYALR